MSTCFIALLTISTVVLKDQPLELFGRERKQKVRLKIYVGFLPYSRGFTIATMARHI